MRTRQEIITEVASAIQGAQGDIPKMQAILVSTLADILIDIRDLQQQILDKKP
jgi:hypothetical protein